MGWTLARIIPRIAVADGYISGSRSVVLDGTGLQEGIDFSLLKGGVTIKGVVRNAAGEPLPQYAIWHTVNGKRIGTVKCLHEDGGEGTYGFTGRNGEFELANCPAMKGLAVTASGAGKSPHWDFRMKHWKMDRRFAYYDEKTIDIGFKPGKNEYYVEIVLDEAKTTMQFQVKNPEGNPVEGAEVAVGTSPYSYGDEFKTTTDNTGRCVFRNLPWIKQPRLTVRKLEPPGYVPLIWRSLELSEGVYNYKVDVTLKYGDHRVPVEKEVTVHALPN